MILGDILTSGSEHVLESLYLSQEYAKRGLYNAAMEEAYRIIQLSPEYLPAHMQLGNSCWPRRNAPTPRYRSTSPSATHSAARGDVNNAINAYERVVDISPLDVSIRARLSTWPRVTARSTGRSTSTWRWATPTTSWPSLTGRGKTYQEGLKLAPRGTRAGRWRARFLRQHWAILTFNASTGRGPSPHSANCAQGAQRRADRHHPDRPVLQGWPGQQRPAGVGRIPDRVDQERARLQSRRHSARHGATASAGPGSG